MTAKLYLKPKDLAQDLQCNPRFVRDMTRGGFRLPATLDDARKFLQRNPHPTQFREKVRKSPRKSS